MNHIFVVVVTIPNLPDYIGHACNNPRAVVPWAAIALDQDKFLDAEHLPIDVHLVEASKMRLEQVKSCLQHWFDRQDGGDKPLVFKYVLPGDAANQSRKRKQGEAMSSKTNSAVIGKDTVLHSQVPSSSKRGSTGKARAILPFMYAFPPFTIDFCGLPFTFVLSPREIPDVFEDQYQFLLSLSQEDNYLQLLGRVAKLPVISCLLLFTTSLTHVTGAKQGSSSCHSSSKVAVLVVSIETSSTLIPFISGCV